MALAMPDKVKATIRRRLRCAYQTADDPLNKETARIAAEAMGVLV